MADRWLGGFWIFVTIVAIVALLHTYFVKPLLQRNRPYRVVSNRPVAHRIWEIAVEPDHGSAIQFAAGQFVWLNLGHSPFSLTEHPFSISSAPAERPRIAFTIKESRDFTGSHWYCRNCNAHVFGRPARKLCLGRQKGEWRCVCCWRRRLCTHNGHSAPDESRALPASREADLWQPH